MERTAAMETQRYRGLLDALREVPSARKWLEERLEFWRLPARGRHKCPVEKGALAVAQCAAIRAVNPGARREQHGMTRGRVPLARRCGARVNVGVALSHDAKFERRSNGYVVARSHGRLEIIDCRLV